MTTDSQAALQDRQMDPFHLKAYQSDYVPADGGQAPLPKTAEPETYHDNRIYVSNIPFSFSDNDLTDLFRRFGEVKSAMIVCNERGSKGFGFVTMDSVHSCEKAKINLHGTKILGRTIEVRKATPLVKPKRGPSSIASSCTSSPRRTQPKMQTKQQPLEIATNPQRMPPSAGGIQPVPPSVAQCRVPPPIAPFSNVISPQANALNLLLGENPQLLQSMFAPNILQHQLNTALQQAFLIPSPTYSGQMASPFLHCTIPPQDGFAYRLAYLPYPYVNSGMMTAPGGYFANQKQNYCQTMTSLNNSLLNGIVLSNSMHAPMQDQRVDLLSLDESINQSKLFETKASGPQSTDSGRKRNHPGGGSPKKISKFHETI